MGLGNPGDQYRETRHNIGYLVVESILSLFRTKLKPGKGSFYYSKFHLRGEEIFVFVSTTYMNNSGSGFMDFLRWSGLSASEVVVVYDDFALPFGTIRIRNSGSDGGHNGLASIINDAKTNNIPRLRLGIGPIPLREDVVDFVLGNFTDEESGFLAEFVEKATDALISVFTIGVSKSMSRFNKNLKEEDNNENK